MIARLIISSSIETIKQEITNVILNASEGSLTNVRSHPDVLYFEAGEKLGIGEARKIKEHFYLKPYSLKGKVVIIEDASVMTPEAQNALLKTLEEPPEEAILILGAPSDANLLPTILSRCEIVILTPSEVEGEGSLANASTYQDIEKLINSSREDRFEYIEKLKDKKEFLFALLQYFHKQLMFTRSNLLRLNFLKDLLQAEQWAKQNVNIRGILEYLMLKMPKKE